MKKEFEKCMCGLDLIDGLCPVCDATTEEIITINGTEYKLRS